MTALEHGTGVAPPDPSSEPDAEDGAALDSLCNGSPLQISSGADPCCDGIDDYRQGGDLFRLIGAEAQGRLMDNIAEAMHGAPADIARRLIAHFYKADPDYGIGVATRLGLSAADLSAVPVAATK
jgi:catalase